MHNRARDVLQHFATQRGWLRRPSTITWHTHQGNVTERTLKRHHAQLVLRMWRIWLKHFSHLNIFVTLFVTFYCALSLSFSLAFVVDGGRINRDSLQHQRQHWTQTETEPLLEWQYAYRLCPDNMCVQRRRVWLKSYFDFVLPNQVLAIIIRWNSFNQNQ